MRLRLLKGAAVLAGIWGVAMSFATSGSPGNNVNVTANLNQPGDPSSLSDTYVYFAQYPGGSTNAVPFGPYSLTNGWSMNFTNPDPIDAEFEYVLMGEYTDSNGSTHVVLGTGNDLTGDSWNTLFGGFSSFAESNIASDLANGGAGDSRTLASFLLSYYIPDVGGIGNYSTNSGYLTSFSNGVNLGTISTAATPEPSPLLLMVALPLFLRKRRKT